MNDEKKAFAGRLKGAMEAKGYPSKPGQLHKLFNSRYEGRSVAFSTASKWLRGIALPEQDKLQVLAELFGVEPHELRFGKSKKSPDSGFRRNDEQKRSVSANNVSASDRQAIDTFLALPPRLRELAGEMIVVMDKAARGGK
ncbi:MAG TPA: hypothetical protein PKE27_18480 [Povalibacter sp.]|uniref:hypothetical protein n=1 Tax=Povalibacter sp. TaxID=1962978 RepID=UPI002BABDACD|nr:hypothetical protein [Povalibacter sp.]HMN46570.1 hypothetical protein [Povalibacter sp.]